MTHKHLVPAFVVGLLLGSVAILYAPVAGFDYINLDDPEYVTENRHVLSGLNRDSIRWAWTAYHSGHWHPLTWLSLMADIDWFGRAPGASHVVNVVLHAGGVVVFYCFLLSATRSPWCSAFAALWFAVHPMRVESVAWITARKDVLSGLFLMLTLLTYSVYARRPSLRRYVLVVLAFAFGLLAKPTLAIVPCALMLLDFWPLRRIDQTRSALREIGRLGLEKIPLVALSAAVLMQTMQSQQAAGARVAADVLPLSDRLANAVTSYVGYLTKTLWPVDLAAFYPLAAVDTATAWMALLLLTMVTIGAATPPYRTQASRPAALQNPRIVGWLWFCGTLLPVSGIIQFGAQAMADRYSYIPHVGLLVALTWSAAAIAERLSVPRGVVALGAASLLVVHSWLTATQVRLWENSITLFTHALSVTENNFMAHFNLGLAFEKTGDWERATHHYKEAYRVNRTWPDAINNYGNTFAWRGEFATAREYYRAALERRPHYALAANNLATAYARDGQWGNALEYFERAVAIDPNYVEARFALGQVLETLGERRRAAEQYAIVLAAEPDRHEATLALERVQGAQTSE